jgi:hypothetical protein
MDPKRPKRPRDSNQFAKLMVDLATSNAEDCDMSRDNDKNPAAVQLGRPGGLRGGQARAEKLTPEQCSDIARKAAQTRYGKKP